MLSLYRDGCLPVCLVTGWQKIHGSDPILRATAYKHHIVYLAVFLVLLVPFYIFESPNLVKIVGVISAMFTLGIWAFNHSYRDLFATRLNELLKELQLGPDQLRQKRFSDFEFGWIAHTHLCSLACEYHNRSTSEADDEKAYQKDRQDSLRRFNRAFELFKEFGLCNDIERDAVFSQGLKLRLEMLKHSAEVFRNSKTFAVEIQSGSGS